jgi:hypothetical protein
VQGKSQAQARAAHGQAAEGGQMEKGPASGRRLGVHPAGQERKQNYPQEFPKGHDQTVKKAFPPRRGRAEKERQPQGHEQARAGADYGQPAVKDKGRPFAGQSRNNGAEKADQSRQDGKGAQARAGIPPRFCRALQAQAPAKGQNEMNQRCEVAVEFPAVAQIQHDHPEGYGAVDQPHAQSGEKKTVAPHKPSLLPASMGPRRKSADDIIPKLTALVLGPRSFHVFSKSNRVVNEELLSFSEFYISRINSGAFQRHFQGSLQRFARLEDAPFCSRTTN